ncbi:hypothetical protein ACF3M1_10775 [Luteimonas sp. WGS1318]|uniref:hypothetical protein n=1 Tax=Luteimonas sp. WGS1318 TaxID=3366815 RepID=UPI00372D3D82
MATETVMHTDNLNAADALIDEARALAEILAQVGDIAEDLIPHMRTVASLIAEKLEGAQQAMSGKVS